MGWLEGKPGESTSFTKTLTAGDASLFAAVTAGMVSAPVADGRLPEFLALTLANTVSSMLAEATGRIFLGMGFDWVHFLCPVYVGDTVAATLTVTERDAVRSRLYAEIRLTNQRQVPVAEALILIKVLS